ncbi:MAG: AMP-binding protein, partial [Desulfobulbaceae bacterium]|nr:AMP-binding protein [Desulfobulbaceae bacterium]
LFHIAGLSILTRSVLTGAGVVLHNNFDAEKVSRVIDEQHITLMSLVPTMLHRLVEVRLAGNKKTALSLRAILIGGAACSETIWQQALYLGLPVLRTYGLTEACSQVATESLSPYSGNIASEAKPLQGIQIKIISPSGLPVNASEEGEILVRGEMVMDHYYKREQQSAEILQNGWLHTGDIGFLTEHGGLCVLNRRSDLIVTGGENVYPAEVEGCLILHSAVEEVCVVGEDDIEFGQCVVAWVVRKKTSGITKEELWRHCRKTLAGYKIPRKIIFLPRLPRNVSGKIMRQNLAT